MFEGIRVREETREKKEGKRKRLTCCSYQIKIFYKEEECITSFVE